MKPPSIPIIFMAAMPAAIERPLRKIAGTDSSGPCSELWRRENTPQKESYRHHQKRNDHMPVTFPGAVRMRRVQDHPRRAYQIHGRNQKAHIRDVEPG